MGHFKSLEVQPEDVFREVAYLLDFLLSVENVNQRKVDGLWTLLVNDIRKWKPDARDEDKMLMTGTVFLMVKKILCHHCEGQYCDIVHGMLEDTLERNLKIYDKQEHQQFLTYLSECSVQLSEWINNYDSGEVWLSDEIEKTLVQVYAEDPAGPQERTDTRKRGRPKETLKNRMINDSDGSKLERLHQLMEGKKGKDAALVIMVSVEKGWMTKPTHTQVKNEFGDVGKQQGFTKYLRKECFTDEEWEGMTRNFS